MKERICTTHSNNYDVLESMVIDILKELCLNYLDKKKVKEYITNNISLDNDVTQKKELDILANDIKTINNNLDNIYIDKLNKKITEEQFERVKSKLNNELNLKQDRYNELNNNINNTINIKSKNKIIEKHIDECLTMNKLSRELILNLVDKVIIYDDKRIDLKVTFSLNN